MNKNSFQLLNNEKACGLSFSLMITLFVFISFLGQALASVIFGSGSAFVAVCATFSCIAMITVIVAFTKNNKQKFTSIVNLKSCKWHYYLLAFGVSIGMLFGFGFINNLVVSLFEKLGLKISGISLNLSTPLHLLVFSLTFAVLPAIFEEFFFRGLLLGELRKTGIFGATLTVSLCFALYHGSLAQLVYQLLYGGVLCLLFISADSVIPCIIAHFLNNFAVLVIEYFKFNVDLYNPLFICAGLIILIFSVTVILVDIVKKENKEKSGKIKDFWLPFGLFGVVICLALALGGAFLGA